MNVGSLFAGVGGFDLAAERAGMEVAWHSEIDAGASAVLAEHWPDVPNLGDIHEIRTPPAVDVLAGGFPCQDYSVAGTRGGLAGDRGALWWEFHRLIAEGRPGWIVGENVPGLLNSRSGRDFGTIIDSIVDLGYRVAWRVLDAQHFGLAQRRQRVFIVGHSGAGSPSQVLAIAEGLAGHPRPIRPAREPAAGAAPGGAPRAYSIVPEGGQGADLRATEIDVAPTIRELESRQTDRGVRVVSIAENQRNEVIESDVVGITAGGGKPGHGYPAIRDGLTVRRLTPMECERLQGFPDGWTASQNDTRRYSQMGNAVAVPVAEWIMRRIAAQE